MRRVLGSAAAMAAVVAAVAGCSSSGTINNAGSSLKTGAPGGTPSGTTSSSSVASKDFASATPSGPSSAPQSSATAGGPTPPASVALVARFIPYPAGARPWVKNKTGPMGLDEFVEAFYVQDAWQDEKGLAKTRGMQGVARHGWFNKDETQTEIYLVKFAAATGAQDMYQDLLDSWSGKTGGFDDAAVHGKGLVNSTPDSQGDTTVKLAFTVGDTFVLVRDYSQATPDKAGTMALGLKQYTALKSGH
jgi:hypothetical protein